MTTIEWIMLVLVIAEFICAMYYKRRAEIIEKGFTTLAKMAYHITNQKDCENLAIKLVEELDNESKRTHNSNYQ